MGSSSICLRRSPVAVLTFTVMSLEFAGKACRGVLIPRVNVTLQAMRAGMFAVATVNVMLSALIRTLNVVCPQPLLVVNDFSASLDIV